ncbi:MAG: hypothetical protein NW241_22115 [Bacteroidia bacterium]|nr:hypothetical protein [Bacteroidia bacterium]
MAYRRALDVVIVFFLLAGFLPQDQPRSSTSGGRDTLLSLSNFGLRVERSSEFQFSLRQGDRLAIDCPACGPAIEKDQLAMSLVSLDGAVSIPVRPEQLSSEIRIDLPGMYQFRTAFKTSPLRKFFQIDRLAVSRAPAAPNDPELEDTLVRVSRLYVGEENGKNRAHPKWGFQLNAGDTLLIRATPVDQAVLAELKIGLKSSSAFEASILRLKPDGSLAIPVTVSSRFELQVSTDPKKFFDLAKDYYDLMVLRRPKRTAGPALDAGLAGSGGAAAAEDPMAAMLKAIEESLKGQAAPPGLELVYNKVSVVRVPAAREITSPRRMAFPIQYKEGQILVYWMCVGRAAFNAYLEEEKNIGNESLLGRYAKSILLTGTAPARLLPDEQSLAEAEEDVEVLLTGEAGRQLYLEGGDPTGLGTGLPVRRVFYQPMMPVPAEPLYLCLSNNNEVSAVEVFIIYQYYNATGLPEAAADSATPATSGI